MCQRAHPSSLLTMLQEGTDGHIRFTIKSKSYPVRQMVTIIYYFLFFFFHFSGLKLGNYFLSMIIIRVDGRNSLYATTDY